MADGIVTLPRAGTVEVIQEFGGAPAAPARPILSPVVIGSAFQIETRKFAGFYQGRLEIADELLGVGDGVTTTFQLNQTPVLTSTLELHVGSITGTLLATGTDYTVTTGGLVTLTSSGVAAVGTQEIHAKYAFAPAQTYVYPDIKQGATVQSPGSEVGVFLKTVEDVFDVTNGFGVVATASSVTVPGDLQPEREVTVVHGQVEISAATGTVEDGSLDFFALGVRPGDILRFITSATELQFSDSVVSSDAADHVVLTIPSTNQVTISPDAPAQSGKVEYEIVRKGSQTGEILITYRALRKDKVGLLLEFESVTELETEFGAGSIVPTNPLPYGIAKALGATDKTVFAMMIADQESAVEHQKALDLLEGEEVYLLVPLTTNAAILQVYHAHAVALSDAESMKERRVIGTVKGQIRKTYQALSATGSMNVGSAVFTDAGAKFVTNGVPIGSVIRLQSPASVELAGVARTELIISGVVSETQVNVVQAVTQGTPFTGEAVGTGTGTQLVFQLAQTQNVIPSSVVVYLDGVQINATEFSVTSGGEVTFDVPPGLGVAITADYEISTLSGIQYTVESQELTSFEIAKDIQAAGEGFKSRRITLTHADSVEADDGTEVPPYFLNCAIAGLVSALPANQPIANVPIPGFLRVKHVRKFTETHFGIMAAGGVSVFIQDRDTSPIVLRNWITTDTTNVNTRECSIVQMADFYAKFLRTNVQSIAGRFNITEDFIDNMLRPAINGVNQELIAAGLVGTRTKIISIEQSTINKDQLLVLEELELFAPANRITITVRIL